MLGLGVGSMGSNGRWDRISGGDGIEFSYDERVRHDSSHITLL